MSYVAPNISLIAQHQTQITAFATAIQITNTSFPIWGKRYCANIDITIAITIIVIHFSIRPL